MDKEYNSTVIKDNNFMSCKNKNCGSLIQTANNNQEVVKLIAIRRTSKTLDEYNKYTDELFKINEFNSSFNCFCKNCLKELKEKFKQTIYYVNKYIKKHYNPYQLSLYNEFVRLNKLKSTDYNIIKKITALSITLQLMNIIISMELHIEYWEKNKQLFYKISYWNKFIKFRNMYNKYKKDNTKGNLQDIINLFDDIRKLIRFQFNIY